MKPVQLMPTVVAVQVETPGSNSTTAAIIVGGLVVLGVGGYFAMAQVNTVNEKIATIGHQTQEATTDANAISQQITEAGQKRDWGLTSATFEDALVAKVNERIDYVQLTRELAGIKPTGAWLEKVSISNPSAHGGEGDTVKLTGYAPSILHVAALVTRINSTLSMDGAHLINWSNEEATNKHVYVKFNIGAYVVSSASGGVAANPNALPISDDDGSQATEVALEPEPGYLRRQVAKAKPVPKLTSLEKVARDSASYEGGS